MATTKGKSIDRLSIAVIINALSHEQLAILGKHFERMSQHPNVLLVKQIPCFPVAFYQLREILLLEKELHQAAKEALYQAGTAFNVPLIRKVIQGSTGMHVFQALPEVDHFIGHGLNKPRFFLGSQRPIFMGNVRRWVETYGVRDKDSVNDENIVLPSPIEDISDQIKHEGIFASKPVQINELNVATHQKMSRSFRL